jgi:hypothetical protein
LLSSDSEQAKMASESETTNQEAFMRVHVPRAARRRSATF